ncbi:MAG TPA: hypothetical protein PKM65_04110 [Spirochaetota bacterium]|nr:hypothetical protein [Spirochaetota bacterium]HNT10733.1 hypothetical protein [Spirochaetota bacterium]
MQININFTINLDDRILRAGKRILSRRNLCILLSSIVLIASLSVYAASIVKPNTFIPGAIIRSDHVNENFDILYDKVNELDALFPRGIVLMWSGAIGDIPTGWALCDGNAHTAPNGDSVTTPDLRDRFIVGAGSAYAIGNTGGVNVHQLTIAEMPAHTHSYLDTYYSEIWGWNKMGPHEGSGGGGDNDNHDYCHTRITDSSGSSNPHENRPPYYALALIMKL